MKDIKETIEAVQNGLATNSKGLPEKTSRPMGLPKHWVARLFQKFQGRYGHKWTSSIEGIESVAIDEWSERLSGLTGAQLKDGLFYWDEDWPPSANEFKRCCEKKTKGLNEYGLNYVPEYYRKPKQLDKSKLLSSTERDESRAKIPERIDKLKRALNGDDL